MANVPGNLDTQCPQIPCIPDVKQSFKLAANLLLILKEINFPLLYT